MNESVVALISISLNEYLMNAPREFSGGPVAAITCRDGTVISVQAGLYHYSTPRDIDGPWTHVEIMMFAKPTFFELDDEDAGTAGFVPIEQVASEILSRGFYQLTY